MPEAAGRQTYVWLFLLVTVCLLLLVLYLFGHRIFQLRHAQVLYIGDSLCEAVHDGRGLSFPEIARIPGDCAGGRTSVEYGVLPAGKTIIFYALGTNDAGKTPVGVYRQDLQRKLAEADAAMVICVLPDNLRAGNEPYRQVMKALCTETVEPRQHGYLFSASDGIHGTAGDHRRFAAWLKARVYRLSVTRFLHKSLWLAASSQP